MFKVVCLTLVFMLTSFAMANRSEKLKKNIAERDQEKEAQRDIAQEKLRKEPKKL